MVVEQNQPPAPAVAAAGGLVVLLRFMSVLSMEGKVDASRGSAATSAQQLEVLEEVMARRFDSFHEGREERTVPKAGPGSLS